MAEKQAYELTQLNEANANIVVKDKSKHGFTPRQKKVAVVVICVLGFLVFVLVAGLIVLGVQLAKRSEPIAVCLTMDCITTVSDLMRSVDNTVDPCEDFYQYACGKWVKNNPIPVTKTLWTTMSSLRANNKKIIHKLVTSKEIRARSTRSEALRKALTFYDVCMNEKIIEKLGAQPLKDLIDTYGSSPGLNPAWNESTWDFNRTLVKLNKELWVNAFFGVMLTYSEKNSSIVKITLYPDGLTIRSSRYNSTTEENIKVKNSLKTYMVRVFELLGLSENKSIAVMESVFSVEKALGILIHTSYTEARKIKNKGGESWTTIKALDSHGGETSINWLHFFKLFFGSTGFQPTEDTAIKIDSMSYYIHLQAFIRNTPESDIANFMMWKVIHQFSDLLSKPFIQAGMDFHKVFGDFPTTARWEKCLIHTKSVFGLAIGRMFVEEAFTNKSKEEAKELVDDIKKVFIADFDHVDWMDEKTRTVAKEKAESMIENIGYPEYIMDDDKLAAIYSAITVGNETYFVNVISATKEEALAHLKKISKPVNRREWNILPSTVNAQYVLSLNAIGLPAGILRPPFFSKRYPGSVNFGGIGSIIGHEMTHGFDNSGRTFNQDGNKRKWWTNASIEAYKKKATCFVDVYSNYSYMGININGQALLGEVIADNAGTKLSFQAYKMWIKDHGEELRLPGVKLTHHQIFFLAYAQIFCGSYKKSTAQSLMMSSSHPINPVRIKGVMCNSEEFSKAYSCPPGSPMNPPVKCEMW